MRGKSPPRFESRLYVGILCYPLCADNRECSPGMFSPLVTGGLYLNFTLGNEEMAQSMKNK
jgi:hypothetical protein